MIEAAGGCMTEGAGGGMSGLANGVDGARLSPYGWLTGWADAGPAITAAPAVAADPDGDDLAVLSRHGRSFRLAGRLLGPDIFARAASLYAVCRAIDDLADETPDRCAADADLRALHADLAGAGARTALGARVRRLAVDRHAAAHLVETMLSDLGPVRIADEASLLAYAHGAAGTVGLMMCDVLGVADQAARDWAIDLGIAMQLTNIARDVREDAARDRLYLPADWLPAGLSPATLADHRAATFNAVRRLLALAETRYRSGALGYPSLPGRSALAIPVAARLYRQIGRQILRAGPAYLDRPRQVVAPATRAMLVATAIARHAASPPRGQRTSRL